jgi:hypothetical protein
MTLRYWIIERPDGRMQVADRWLYAMDQVVAMLPLVVHHPRIAFYPSRASHNVYRDDVAFGYSILQRYTPPYSVLPVGGLQVAPTWASGYKLQLADGSQPQWFYIAKWPRRIPCVIRDRHGLPVMTQVPFTLGASSHGRFNLHLAREQRHGGIDNYVRGVLNLRALLAVSSQFYVTSLRTDEKPRREDHVGTTTIPVASLFEGDDDVHQSHIDNARKRFDHKDLLDLMLLDWTPAVSVAKRKSRKINIRN